MLSSKENEFLNHIRSLWLEGDWQGLANLATDEFVISSAEACGYIAVALLKLGKVKEAINYNDKALALGKNKAWMGKVILSGLFDTLAQASAIQSKYTKAGEYWKLSAKLAASKAEWKISAKARSINAIRKMGHSLSNVNFSVFEEVNSKKRVEIIKKIDLGKAWAGNTINTVIFRHHAIFTVDEIQYTAFYVNSSILRIVKRNLQKGIIEKHDIFGNYNIKDAHNAISLGMDRKGFLHISYDHHGNKLNYRRSIRPHNIKCWSDILLMTGKNEDRVTYPCFILPTRNTPLLMLYRDGNWKKGTAYLKYYDENKETWFDNPEPILSGSEQKPWTSNAYWCHPVINKEGCLHLAFTWRTDYFSKEELINNIDIDYAKSIDAGKSWFSSKNKPFKLPITQVNSETVWPISPGSNHINQTSMALDSKGYPHIAFYADDDDGVTQYQHLWFDGRVWQKQQVTDRTKKFRLAGGGTLEIPISRPEIIIDKDDFVYFIYRSQETGQKLVATCLQPPSYEIQAGNTQVLLDAFVGQAEPIIDRLRWENDQILSLLVQFNEQPNGDLKHFDVSSVIQIVDITFNTFVKKDS